jgi:hypothetical protein
MIAKMFTKPINWRQRLIYLTAYLLITSVISILFINAGVHFLLVGLVVLICGFVLAYWISSRREIIYIYMFTSITACFVSPSTFNDIQLSNKGLVKVNMPKDVPGTDGAIYEFSNAYVEKEKYGHYLYSYRSGHDGYFVAPVVEKSWIPGEAVFVWAVFEAGDILYDSLIFGTETNEIVQFDPTTTIIESDTSPVSLDYSASDQVATNGIHFTEWNNDYRKGAVINDDLTNYFDAIKNAESKHGLVSAENSLLIKWTDAPEMYLEDQKKTSTLMLIVMLAGLVFWFVLLEIKIAREMIK